MIAAGSKMIIAVAVAVVLLLGLGELAPSLGTIATFFIDGVLSLVEGDKIWIVGGTLLIAFVLEVAGYLKFLHKRKFLDASSGLWIAGSGLFAALLGQYLITGILAFVGVAWYVYYSS